MEYRRPRRFYLHQRMLEAECENWGLAGAWRSKQEAQPGTSLPDDFPSRDALIAAGYSTYEDIDGADHEELERIGIGHSDASKILAAIPAS